MPTQAEIDAARKVLEKAPFIKGATNVEEPLPDLSGVGSAIYKTFTTPVRPFIGPGANPQPAMPPAAVPVAAPPPVQAAAAAPTPIPASIAAPGVENTVPPATFSAPQVQGGSIASAMPTAPAVSLSPANPVNGPSGRDTRAAEINSKYDSALNNLNEQLRVENAQVQDGSTTANPAKVAALKVKIADLSKQKQNALNANNAAYGMYVTDENGNTHLDSSKLGNITPRQKSDYQLANQVLEQNNLAKSQNAEKQAIESRVNAETAHNDATAAAYTDMASQMKQAAVDREKRQAVFQAELQKKNDEVNNSIADFNKSAVDPNRYWHNQNTGSLIGTALMAGLVGGLNAANNIQGNPVLSRIDQLINNDIDAQKANIAKKAKGIEMQNSAISTFERQGFDREQAIAMTQAAGYDAAKMQLQGVLAKTDNQAAKAQGQMLAAQLDQRSAQVRSQALTPYVNASIAAHTIVPGAGMQKGRSKIQKDAAGNEYVINYATGKPEHPTQEDYKFEHELTKGSSNAKNERFINQASVQIPGSGKTVYFHNPQQAESYQQQLKFVKDSLDEIKRLEELGTKNIITFSGEDKGHNKAIHTTSTALATSYGKAINPGQSLSPDERESFTHDLDPGYVGDPNNGVILRDWKEALKKKLEEIEALGSPHPPQYSPEEPNSTDGQ